MNNHLYSLEVLVNGRPATEYYKDGKSFIESRVGTEYTLRFRNNCWKRVLAIFSVDGIEVIKGKAAAESENGYVVDAFSSIEVKGYRISDREVAAFTFTRTNESYSNTVGAATKNPFTGKIEQEKSTRNNGVIGVRVYVEDAPDYNYGVYISPQYNSSSYISSNLGAFLNNSMIYASGCVGFNNINSTNYTSNIGGGTTCNSSAYYLRSSNINQLGKLEQVDSQIFKSLVSPNFDQGTTWGQKVKDKVKTVQFNKSKEYVDLEIFYASRESLEKYGIDFGNIKQVFGWPSAFEDKKEFCKVPDWYKL